jgi:hypothetical protein
MEYNIKQLKHQLKNNQFYLLVLCLLTLGSFSLGFLFGSQYPKVLGRQTSRQVLPVRPPDPHPDEPLRKYSIQNLQSYPFQVSEINLDRVLEKNASFTSYVFSYRTLGKKMTGQINIPTESTDKPFPVIVMVRGYVDPEQYKTGEGTRYVAAEFARAGYVTVAPDFLGFGGSDPSGPGWEERFEKPVNVIELIKSLRLHSQLEFKKQFFPINPQKMGIWAHSNGGQITLSTLEALGEPIPATLWAPVTAPFPYSVLYYSDEMDDGGRGMRSAVAGFESLYNVQEYSWTQYMNRLRGPIQLHQGTADDAVPLKWSDEFVRKVSDENDRRQQKQLELAAKIKAEEESKKISTAAASVSPSPLTSIRPATASAIPSLSPNPSLVPSLLPSPIASASTTPALDAPFISTPSTALILAESGQDKAITEISSSIKVEDVYLQPIDINYFVYKGGNHAIRPGWEDAVARDLRFFFLELGDQ